MRFRVEPGPRGNWRVMLQGADAPVSEHDTEEEARERLGQYVHGAAAAAAPTIETGIARGDRARLADGAEVILRPVRSVDAPLLLESFSDHFGDQSRYQRFLASKRGLTPRELSYFTDIDHDRHEAIGALDPGTGEGIGIARFVRAEAEATTAEAAFAVVDEWQGRGLGGLLLRRLADRALELGVVTFTASLLTTNKTVLVLFGRLGEMDVHREEGTVTGLTVQLRA